MGKSAYYNSVSNIIIMKLGRTCTGLLSKIRKLYNLPKGKTSKSGAHGTKGGGGEGGSASGRLGQLTEGSAAILNSHVRYQRFGSANLLVQAVV
jgi:hypothetical protein